MSADNPFENLTGMLNNLTSSMGEAGPSWARYVAPTPQKASSCTEIIPDIVVTGMMMHACVSGNTLFKRTQSFNLDIFEELYDDIKSKIPLVFVNGGRKYFVNSDSLIDMHCYSTGFSLKIFTFDESILDFIKKNADFHKERPQPPTTGRS